MTLRHNMAREVEVESAEAIIQALVDCIEAEDRLEGGPIKREEVTRAKAWLAEKSSLGPSHLGGGSVYPCTIVSDRYGGTYSGGNWVAWPLDYDRVPFEPEAPDLEAEAFWLQPRMCGKGATPDEAVQDLVRRLRKS